MLDAFLRFPVVHDIDSLFGLKQIMLITIKLAAYALGFRNIGKHVGWFVLCILCCVFTLPILWLTALPIGDTASYHQKTDALDVDVAVQCWRVLTKPGERAEAKTRWQAMFKKGVVRMAEAMPFLRPVALRLDPNLNRVMQKGRAV